MKYFISLVVPNKKDSGAYGKARRDVDSVLEKKGYTPIRIPFSMIQNRVARKVKIAFIIEYLSDLYYWIKIFLTINTKSTLVYQHPMQSSLIVYYMIRALKYFKKIKIISLVHDLYTLRDGKDNSTWYRQIKDIGILNLTDAIICHNNKMKEYLIQMGISSKKIVVLGLFDYLYKGKIEEKHDNCSNIKSICIAGNLSRTKCGYIYKLNEIGQSIIFDLYGNGYERNIEEDNVRYCGSYPADILPGMLNEDFGLVWDGNDLDECSGSVGKYIMYNNPHKVSLYLMSELPVIIWKKAALADFIDNNNLGFSVESLKEIPDVIRKMSDLQIKQMKENVKKVGYKLRNGGFVSDAIEAAEYISGEI